MTTDFQLDDLFNVEAHLPLPNSDDIVVRVLTETEVQARDEAALHAFDVEDKKLRDVEGEDYKRILGPLDDADRDTLIALATAVDATRYSVQVVRDYPLRFYPFPDEATTEEKVEILRQQDEHEVTVRAARRRAVERHIEEFRLKQEGKTDEELRKLATNAIVNASADTARQNEFQIQTAYYATRKGDSQGSPYFTLDVIRAHGKKEGLSEAVYNRILVTYNQLDSADPWELQKKH